MRLEAILAVVIRQLFLIRGSLSRFLPLFAWVAIDMVLWGFITRYLNTVAASGMNFVPTLLGAVLLWDYFTRVMQGVTMTFLEDVWSRNFLNLFASPLTTGEYLGGLVVTGALMSFVGLAVMLVLTTVVFGLSFFAYGVMVVPFLAILLVFGIALGIVSTAMVLKLGPAAEWFVWPIPALVSPFAGVFYPVATLPAWMQAVARVLPASYVFEALRAIATGKTPSGNPAVAGLLLAVAYVLVAGWIFQRTYRSAVRSGILARYSAETVT